MFVSNDIIHKREIEACHEQAGVGMAAECFGGAAGFGRLGRVGIALSGADGHAAEESKEQGCEEETEPSHFRKSFKLSSRPIR